MLNHVRYDLLEADVERLLVHDSAPEEGVDHTIYYASYHGVLAFQQPSQYLKGFGFLLETVDTFWSAAQVEQGRHQIL